MDRLHRLDPVPVVVVVCLRQEDVGVLQHRDCALLGRRILAAIAVRAAKASTNRSRVRNQSVERHAETSLEQGLARNVMRLKHDLRGCGALTNENPGHVAHSASIHYAIVRRACRCDKNGCSGCHAIEDAHLLPGVFVLGDEPLMPGVDLVIVVGLAAVENDVQADVKVDDVDRPGQIGDARARLQKRRCRESPANSGGNRRRASAGRLLKAPSG